MTNWSEKVVTLDFEEESIIRNILKLHINKEKFDLDPTFSTGRFYKNTLEPKYKFDIFPQREDVSVGDCRNLPICSESIYSIMFDPPFVVGPSSKPGIIRDRFSCYKNIGTLWKFYSDSLIEFYRILEDGGFLCFKCQDTVSGGVNYMSHVKIIFEAQKIGFYIKDLFVLGRKNVMWSPNMKNQQHARKNHCYFLVLQKINMNNQKKKSIIF